MHALTSLHFFCSRCRCTYVAILGLTPGTQAAFHSGLPLGWPVRLDLQQEKIQPNCQFIWSFWKFSLICLHVFRSFSFGKLMAKTVLFCIEILKWLSALEFFCFLFSAFWEYENFITCIILKGYNFNFLVNIWELGTLPGLCSIINALFIDKSLQKLVQLRGADVELICVFSVNTTFEMCLFSSVWCKDLGPESGETN